MKIKSVTLNNRKRAFDVATTRQAFVFPYAKADPPPSPAQFYRLLDPTNYRKSIDKVLLLLHVLDCDVDLVVRKKSA